MDLNINNIKFNMTEEMSWELIKFNELKKEYDGLKLKYSLNKDENLLLNIKLKEKEMINTKNKFIKYFKKSNAQVIKDNFDTIRHYFEIEEQNIA